MELCNDGPVTVELVSAPTEGKSTGKAEAKTNGKAGKTNGKAEGAAEADEARAQGMVSDVLK